VLGLASTSDEDQAAWANASLGLIKPHGQRFEVAAPQGETPCTEAHKHDRLRWGSQFSGLSQRKSPTTSQFL